VLLNPLGWCPRPAGGWAARPTSVAAQFSGDEPEEVSVSDEEEYLLLYLLVVVSV
jgi:hypothetical protein